MVMTDGELFRAGELLIAGMADLGATKWPTNIRAFALAIDDIKEGNDFARKFFVVHGSTGRYCHDFRTIQGRMHQATLISYDSIDYDRFNVRISKRGVKTIHARTQVTDKEKEEVRALLLAHWERAYGRPWKDPET
jgi:hypothetical protein